MSDKDTETQSYPMERLTSEAPPPYSEVVGHSPTVNKDPASERNEQAPPYQHPALQQYISLPPVRLVSNNLMPPPRRVIVTPPPTRVVVVTPPQPSAPTTVPRRRPELYTRGDTQLSQNQVQDQVNFKLCCTVFCSILLFFLATPLSLLVTLPSLYCVCKVCVDRTIIIMKWHGMCTI